MQRSYLADQAGSYHGCPFTVICLPQDSSGPNLPRGGLAYAERWTIQSTSIEIEFRVPSFAAGHQSANTMRRLVGYVWNSYEMLPMQPCLRLRMVRFLVRFLVGLYSHIGEGALMGPIKYDMFLAWFTCLGL